MFVQAFCAVWGGEWWLLRLVLCCCLFELGVSGAGRLPADRGGMLRVVVRSRLLTVEGFAVWFAVPCGNTGWFWLCQKETKSIASWEPPGNKRGSGPDMFWL